MFLSSTVPTIILINNCVKRKVSSFVLLLVLLISANKFVLATEDNQAELRNTIASTNFAFASYLGTGFYTSSGQSVFVLQIPLDHTIKQKTDTESGLLLNLPLTLGVINFDRLDLENLPELSDLTTITFLPGLEYQIPVKPNWTVSPFVDYGFARDFNNNQNILIYGLGVKSIFDYHLDGDNALLTLGNRFLYAREKTPQSNNDADYSLVATWLNYSKPMHFTSNNGNIHSNLYYTNFYYPNNLVFLENTNNPIRVGVEHEVGITVSNLPDFLFFDKPQLGLGVRFGKDTSVIRLIFGSPF